MRKQDKSQISLPKTFKPAFWEDADGRCSLVKLIRKRYEVLSRDAGCNSYQKDLLCQRATFLAIQLETMERQAVEEGHFDSNKYTGMINSLLGLLKALGLEKKAKKVGLNEYLETKA